MVPIYFPFTWISMAELHAIKTFFNRCVVYQPTKGAFDLKGAHPVMDESLVFRFPATGNEEELASTLSQYLNWADLHQGTSLPALKKDLQKIPFFDSSSAAQIKTDIQHGKAAMKDHEMESAKQRDLLFNARLFLCLAQVYDQVNYQLYNDFRKIESMQQGLMNSLSGVSQDASDDDSDLQLFSEKDQSLIMESKRLAAWARLIQCEGNPSALFITCSPTLFNTVTEQCPTGEEICDIRMPSIPAESEESVTHWQKQLINHFERLACTPRPLEGQDPIPKLTPKAGEPKFKLKVTMVTNEKPETFWNDRFLEDKIKCHRESSVSSYENTLLGLIEACHQD
jgi:hypothetical protein